MAEAALPLPYASAQAGEIADSFWRSLFYFNYYRMAVAAMFLLGPASRGVTAEIMMVDSGFSVMGF